MFIFLILLSCGEVIGSKSDISKQKQQEEMQKQEQLLLVKKAEQEKDFNLFTDAVYSGTIDEIKALAPKCNLLINEQDKNGQTALNCAIFRGEIQIIELVLSFGANIDVLDNHGETPLIASMAVETRNNLKEVVAFLLSKKVKLDVEDMNGNSALSNAINIKNLEVAKLLIEAGADINRKNKYGETALFVACQDDYLEGVEFLLNQNINKDELNKEGKRAVDAAKDERIKKLLNGKKENKGDVNKVDANGLTLLMLEIDNGLNIERIDEILRREDIEIDKVDKNGQTALTHLCNRQELGERVEDYKMIIDKLLARGAKIDLKDNLGNTALIYASCFGHLELVLKLLEQNADVNVKNNDFDTALMYAAQGENSDLVLELIRKDATNLNDQNNIGMTALMYACQNGNLKTVNILLAQPNLNLEVVNKLQSNKTALKIVQEYLSNETISEDKKEVYREIAMKLKKD